MFYLRVPLFFGLIWALSSFAFAAIALAVQIGQDSFISPRQVSAVVALCSLASLCALGLLVSIAVDLLGRRLTLATARSTYKAWLGVGVVFLAIAAYSFFVVPAESHEDFFRRFAHGARFEFLLVGVSALLVNRESGARSLV